MDYEVRPARPEDLPALADIENSGDPMFAEIGIVFPPGPTVIEQLIGKPAEIVVAGDPPVGFAAVEEVDGAAHLEQISVRGDLTGRGIGARLLAEVMARAAAAGSPGVSLLTFRDVPWNGPWYARHGFAELPEEQWGPGIRSYWAAEIEAGLHDLGPRVVMWAPAARPGVRASARRR
ncbi:GNAT family N-acetyltransferase [Actinomadura bangladeshensis]|uniref:GNAT family N-acetyltransferase n=1 Tax=Actinomadura bangladeshensis TaxID=453573 RepID=A0A4V2XJS3_9ACTN|nr:GNAT family N-acetyltransferase [Actinomadura bangladeshensis]TDC03786.1 GNAT family N-acetyltransferase [Actinomadura bangladeshensis]